jgi:7,8-dihydropterin-6-yl-methyl-4-(beta-D-ribofuranosyl)aminobenzene 5'-phosphate synthase
VPTPDAEAEPGETATSTTGSGSPHVVVTVLYDNQALSPGTKADWGFSCLIGGREQVVLFDTGANGEILLANMRALGIDAGEIDVVVLSHNHEDHTGGLDSLLAVNPNIMVYYPASFPETFGRVLQQAGASGIPVDEPVTPCAGLLVTAPVGSIGESAAVLETAQGPVMLTGCAHPGIVQMATAVSSLIGGPLLAVLGGFHLGSRSEDEVDGIIQDLQAWGVARCGPAHCTGEAATARIKAAFSTGFIEMGVGATVSF